jgi:hypothetical protein
MWVLRIEPLEAMIKDKVAEEESLRQVPLSLLATSTDRLVRLSAVRLREPCSSQISELHLEMRALKSTTKALLPAA